MYFPEELLQSGLPADILTREPDAGTVDSKPSQPAVLLTHTPRVYTEAIPKDLTDALQGWTRVAKDKDAEEENNAIAAAPKATPAADASSAAGGAGGGAGAGAGADAAGAGAGAAGAEVATQVVQEEGDLDDDFMAELLGFGGGGGGDDDEGYDEAGEEGMSEEALEAQRRWYLEMDAAMERASGGGLAPVQEGQEEQGGAGDDVGAGGGAEDGAEGWSELRVAVDPAVAAAQAQARRFADMQLEFVR